MGINDNQSNQQGGQPKPRSAQVTRLPDAAAKRFVVLPSHPLYGQRVTIVARRVRTTYVDCTIETPERLGIPYHIRECWLSSTAPPPSPDVAFQLSAICVRLSALDKMVQQLLTTAYFRRISHDEPADTPSTLPDRVTRSPAADLEATASGEPRTAPTAPVLPGPGKGRRNLP
jgi:hypothetical protein